MKFQQLKSDSNSILKKQLVKSSKNWIVVSSFAIASGLLLMNYTNVQADAVDDSSSITPVSAQQVDSNNNLVEQTQEPAKAVNDSEITAKSVESNGSNLTENQNTGSVQPAEDETPKETETVDPEVLSKETNDNLESSLADDPTVTDKTTNVDTRTADFNIPNDALYQGSITDNPDSSKWYISTNKTLHIGPGTAGTFKYNDSPFKEYSDNIDTISIDGPVIATDYPVEMTDPTFSFGITGLFSNLTNLTSIDNIDELDVSQTSSISFLFKNDPVLTSLDLSKWDTKNVTSMAGIFQGDLQLSTLNIKNWNVEKVTEMDNLFADTNLSSIDLSNWHAKAIQTMSGMFSYNEDINLTSQPRLTYIDFSNFDTSHVSAMDYLFYGQTKLTTIKFPQNFNTSKVQYIYFMFYGDESLKSIDISNYDTKESLNDENNLGTTIFYDNPSLEAVTLGPKNYFNKSFSLPSDISDTWINIGNGSFEKPEGNIIFKTILPGGDPYGDVYKIYNGDPNAPIDTFVPKRNTVTADVTIPSNLGDQIVTEITGKVGTTVDVPVPNITGYTADKTTVKANVYNNNTIVAAEKVTYTKIDNPNSNHSNNHSSNHHNHGSSNSNSNSNNNSTEYYDQDIATYYDKPAVPLYNINSNNTSNISNRELANGTSWFSDEKETSDNQVYYRVSTSEWVKASQVYPYWNLDQNILTNSDSNKRLYTAEGNLVYDRELAKDSAWHTDHFIKIDNVKYYRVSTNEFVKASDVSEY